MGTAYDVKTTQRAMTNPAAALKRRLEVSAEISDYVYDYETKYNEWLEIKNNTAAGDKAPSYEDIHNLAIDRTKVPSDTVIVDAMYDESTGIAALAVRDEQTNETYIAYAGTNYKADGYKDIVSDAAIGTNNALALKVLGNKAVEFYDRVQSTGANITVSTGHSYGDFIASRVAIERSVPYKFGYQGAPQSATSANSVTASLSYLSSLLPGVNPTTGKLLAPFLNSINPAKQLEANEYKRVQNLIDSYPGYAVTFSTTGDVLTNLLWAQSGKEIAFNGSQTTFGKLHTPLQGIKNYFNNAYGVEINGNYVGNVIAIDENIQHSMRDFRKSEEAMATAFSIVAEEIAGVDVNSDGLIDFMVTADYTRTDSLVPASALAGNGGLTIAINPADLSTLSSNLGAVLAQVGDLIMLTSNAITANEGVMETLTGRRDDLKTVIVNHLQSISLVQAVSDIDAAYKALSDISGELKTVSNYNITNFTSHFNWWEYIAYDFFEGRGGPKYDYGKTKTPLSTAVDSASTLKGNIETSLDFSSSASGESSSGGNLVSLGSQTTIGQSAENLINSFEEKIEKTTQGIDNRSAYEDGIPDALNEILPVVAQNLYTVYLCIEYLISVVDTIKTTMETTDANLASGIDAFDFSAIPDVDVTVPSSYSTFLEDSDIFDDKAVMAAYDDQVDKKAENLATEMSSAFSSWLDTAAPLIETTNSSLNAAEEAFPSVSSQFPIDIYRKLKADSDSKEERVGSIGELISISSTITSLEGEFPDIDSKLTTAATTINTVYSYLGGFKEPFRAGMEDAFYGADGLTGIVNSQQAVTAVLTAIKTRMTSFQSQLSHNKGAAIDALNGKVDTSITIMGYVVKLLDECFGN